MSLKGLLTLAVIGCALYFGWPIIEAVLIILPIPDPKDVTEKVKAFISNLTAPKSGAPTGTAKKGYTGNFNQLPETLGDSDEEIDDISKPPTVT